ncbi:MAG: TraR/DksA family transcriptional regulator [Acidobacteria bacterium]|nr:TraR/DksA family transcriptional regulator [Acidobacteriota bacterium]
MTQTTAPQHSTAADLSAEEMEELRERLVQERDSILALYRHDLRAGQNSMEEASEDIVDRANSAYNRELNFALSDSERDQLRKVENALRRMDDGNYGVCLHSGKPIGLARLRAVPWAEYRVEYQELAEKGLLNDET